MKNKLIHLSTSITLLCIPAFAQASPYFSLKDGDGFKRFSVSAGWLHAMPQGNANPFQIGTSAKNGSYKVGDVKVDTVTGVIADTPEGKSQKDKLLSVVKLGETIGIVKDGMLTSQMSGSVNIDSLEGWSAENTGLEADTVDTLGLMMNYHFTDNWSLEVKAGIPPTVDIAGKGNISAPLNGTATPEGKLESGFINNIANGLINDIGAIPLNGSIPITSLEQSKKAASARAWLPAAEIHYQFGRSGVNKFRPYVGVGVMYAYFDKVKLDQGIEADLVTAGHMIQNILDNKAGAALEKKTSSANPVVKVKATDTFAPIATVGATYDFNQNWFAVGSVSYSKMNNKAKINVYDSNTGNELINASTKIDINPIITYLGVGYRF